MMNVIVKNGSQCDVTEFIDDGMRELFLKELVKLDDHIKAMESKWKSEWESEHGKERFSWNNRWYLERLDIIDRLVNEYNTNEDRYFNMRYYSGNIYGEAINHDDIGCGLYFYYVEQ